jgi:hypothetical protein
VKYRVVCDEQELSIGKQVIKELSRRVALFISSGFLRRTLSITQRPACVKHFGGQAQRRKEPVHKMVLLLAFESLAVYIGIQLHKTTANLF